MANGSQLNPKSVKGSCLMTGSTPYVSSSVASKLITNAPRAAPLIGHVVPMRFLNSTMITHTMNGGQTTDKIGAANATMAFKPRLQMAKETNTVTITPKRYEI